MFDFEEYQDRKRQDELPKHKYRARNQFQSRMPSATSLQEKRRSFKAKRSLSRTRGRNQAKAALGSSLERDDRSDDLIYVTDRSKERSRSGSRTSFNRTRQKR
jgi:hypothetical protein